VLELTTTSGPGVSVFVHGSDPNPGPYHYDISDETDAVTKVVTAKRDVRQLRHHFGAL